MASLSIGIDASADTVVICAVDETGQVVGERSCASAPVTVAEHLSAIAEDRQFTVGIEAGSTGTYLTRKLRANGFTLRVLETRHVSGFLQLTQNKTDQNDARGIAEIVRLGTTTVPDVLIKEEAIQRLRSELVLRHRLMKQRIAIENTLRAVFRLNGGKIGRAYSGTHLENSVATEIERLKDDGVDIAAIVIPVLDIIVALRRTLERADRRLLHAAKDIHVCRLFMGIPGVGSICALSFYTAIDHPERFQKTADVGPYLGLVPKIAQSGLTLRRGRISRRGNTMTRTHLVSAAKSLMQQSNRDSALRRWTMRLAERAGRGKARVALARKLATVMLAIWKSGEAFRPI